MRLLPGDWSPVTRMLVGWDIGIVSYLGAVVWMMVRAADHHGLKQRAATQEDEGAGAILFLTVAAAAASLGAIFAELAQASSGEPGLRLSCRTRGRHRPAVLGIHTHDLRAALCV